MNVQEPKIISLPSSSLTSLLAFSLLFAFLMEERIANSLAKSDLGLRVCTWGAVMLQKVAPRRAEFPCSLQFVCNPPPLSSNSSVQIGQNGSPVHLCVFFQQTHSARRNRQQEENTKE